MIRILDMKALGKLNDNISSLGRGRRTICRVAFLFLLSVAAIFHSAQVTTESGIAGIVPPAGVSYRDSWAVVIGINRYTKAPRLNYAVNDANSVVAAVQQLGFAPDKILLLLDREATKQRIEQVLYGTLRRTTPEDRVFVFFAGHGLTSSLPRGGDEGFLLPVDGDPEDLPLTAIAMEDVRKIARRIPAKHILFAVDACYSGFTITRDVAPSTLDRAYLEAITKEPAVQIITAGRKGEPVLEEEGHGLFTRRLLSGLTGLADTDQNGLVTAQELATWLESRVVRDSQDRQHPQYSRLDGEGQFVFLVPGRQPTAAPTAQTERETIQEEMEQFKRERALFEEQRKLQEDRQKIELAKLEAERTLFLAERERFEIERTRAEGARQEIERKQKTEQAAKADLAKLEAERSRLLGEEERLANLRVRAEETRLEIEERRKMEDAATASEPQAIAKLTPPPPRPVVLPTVAQVPKYSVGDSWTVKFADGRTATRKVRAIERDQYIFEWGLDLVRYYDRDLILRKQITPENGKDFPSYLEKQRAMDFPLSVNKNWEFRTLILQDGSGTRPPRFYYRVFSSKVLGTETIQISAGTFGAFKVEDTVYEILCFSVGTSNCRTLPITTTVHHLWYAPEVKFPVKVAHVKGPYIMEQEPDYELAAYELK